MFFIIRFFMPRGWRERQKYQGKLAKMQYKDAKRARIDAQLSGETDHSVPVWREPTVAALVGRAKSSARHRAE